MCAQIKNQRRSSAANHSGTSSKRKRLKVTHGRGYHAPERISRGQNTGSPVWPVSRPSHWSDRQVSARLKLRCLATVNTGVRSIAGAGSGDPRTTWLRRGIPSIGQHHCESLATELDGLIDSNCSGATILTFCFHVSGVILQ